MKYVYLKPMPGYCREFVTQNTDGSYTIVINSILCAEQQREAYEHALRHIECGHFDHGCAEDAEREAHAQEEERRTV